MTTIMLDNSKLLKMASSSKKATEPSTLAMEQGMKASGKTT